MYLLKGNKTNPYGDRLFEIDKRNFKTNMIQLLKSFLESIDLGFFIINSTKKIEKPFWRAF